MPYPQRHAEGATIASDDILTDVDSLVGYLRPVTIVSTGVMILLFVAAVVFLLTEPLFYP